jgi:uncharacterized membrane protein
LENLAELLGGNLLDSNRLMSEIAFPAGMAYISSDTLVGHGRLTRGDQGVNMGTRLIFFIIGAIILVDVVAIVLYIRSQRRKKKNNNHQNKPKLA